LFLQVVAGITTMKSRALAARGVTDANLGEKIRLAFDRHGAGAVRQVGDRPGAAQRIRHRHDRAAVHHPGTIGEFRSALDKPFDGICGVGAEPETHQLHEAGLVALEKFANFFDRHDQAPT
jgi:hypothetical protein